MEAIAASPAFVAYCGHAPLPSELLGRWNFDPPLVLILAAATFLVLWRGELSPLRRRAFMGAMATLAVAFVSPLCALTSALFSARVVHHLLTVAVAAPLLAMALPARRPYSTGVALSVASAILWAWHLPALYTAALGNSALYWLMQTTLLGSAWWFWRNLFASPPMPAVGWLAAASGQMGLLGAIITFAPRPLYPHHLLAPFAWGMTPLQDQQLAGLIMWVPAILPYALAAILIGRRGWAARVAA